MKEAFADRFDRSVVALRAQGVRFEKIAVDLGISMGTFHNWRHAETANIDLDTFQQVSDYLGWTVEISQRELALRGDSAWSNKTLLDLAELERRVAVA